MEDDECLAEFRVRKCDISLFEEALQIPEEFMLEQQSVVKGMEGFYFHYTTEHTKQHLEAWARRSGRFTLVHPIRSFVPF